LALLRRSIAIVGFVVEYTSSSFTQSVALIQLNFPTSPFNNYFYCRHKNINVIGRNCGVKKIYVYALKWLQCGSKFI